MDNNRQYPNHNWLENLSENSGSIVLTALTIMSTTLLILWHPVTLPFTPGTSFGILWIELLASLLVISFSGVLPGTLAPICLTAMFSAVTVSRFYSAPFFSDAETSLLSCLYLMLFLFCGSISTIYSKQCSKIWLDLLETWTDAGVDDSSGNLRPLIKTQLFFNGKIHLIRCTKAFIPTSCLVAGAHFLLSK